VHLVCFINKSKSNFFCQYSHIFNYVGHTVDSPSLITRDLEGIQVVLDGISARQEGMGQTLLSVEK